MRQLRGPIMKRAFAKKCIVRIMARLLSGLPFGNNNNFASLMDESRIFACLCVKFGDAETHTNNIKYLFNVQRLIDEIIVHVDKKFRN